MASAHFMIYHLREFGLRSKVTAQRKGEEDEKDDEMECEDVEFADTMAQIAESTKKNGAEKLGKCSKFTISIANEKKGTKMFLMDALFAFLRAHVDPQSVESDLSLETGNICDLRADIRRFLRDFNIGGRSFATGINFYYHKHFETAKGTVDVDGFGGHPQSDLFVRARFDSLKNEILSSKFLSVSDFEEFVTAKTNKYLVTDDCKAIECKEYSDLLHFDIKHKEPLRAE